MTSKAFSGSDAFAQMRQAGAAASTSRFDPAQIKDLAGVVIATLWDLVDISGEFVQHVNQMGFAYIDDAEMAEAIDALVTCKAHGGEFYVNGQKISIVPWEAKKPIWDKVVSFLSNSKIDRILRHAAAYYRNAQIIKHSKSAVAPLPEGTEDPYTIRTWINECMGEASQMMAGHQVTIRAKKVAGEYALLVWFMGESKMINSIGVPTAPDEKDPLTAFIQAPQNPRPHWAKAMALANALNASIELLAEYDPAWTDEEYDEYFERLGKAGQLYCRAAENFAVHLPQAFIPRLSSAPLGLAQLEPAMLEILRLKVEVTMSTSGESSATTTTTVVSMGRQNRTLNRNKANRFSSGLDGPSSGVLHDTVLRGFDKAELTKVARSMGQNLEAIAGGDNLSGYVATFISWAERTGRLEELLRACEDNNPTFPHFVVIE